MRTPQLTKKAQNEKDQESRVDDTQYGEPLATAATSGGDSVREELAELQHEQWTGWMRYLFSRCEPCSGGMRIPSAWVERWQHQMDTPYARLNERDQNSDRKEADRVLRLLGLRTAPDAVREDVR